MQKKKRYDAVIVGGGAAGLMCALEAAKRGRRVALLEHNDVIGRKILISGGGRCNFTNLHCGPEHFISENPHFAKSALARYRPADFIALLERNRIPYHEKTLGQLFCDRSAHNVTGMLEQGCNQAGVSLHVRCRIREIGHGSEFLVHSDAGEFEAPALVVATGGLSIPKIGATSFGYDVADRFGVKVIPPRPALVPLLLDDTDQARYCDLAGLSAAVIVSSGRQSFREKMLFTHRGLSGPAILQISSYWQTGRAIHIDLAPDCDVPAALLQADVRCVQTARSWLQTLLPRRLATRWLDLNGPPAWNRRAPADLERSLHAWTLVPAGTEGYKKAEVTAGGVDTDELSARTMESRKVKGLFFIGEVVDVTGHLGGFNFQWAWASGAAAGRAL